MKVFVQHFDMTVRRPEEGFHVLEGVKHGYIPVYKTYPAGSPIIDFKMEYTTYDWEGIQELRDKFYVHRDAELILDDPSYMLTGDEVKLLISEIQDLAEMTNAKSEAIVEHGTPAVQYLLSVITDIKNAVKDHNWNRE